PYEAPKHFNVWSARKLGDKDAQHISVSLSHFLPNGGVEMSGSPTEKMYYIVSGSMVVKTRTEESTLEAGDIVYFAPGEEREIRVAGSDVCTILVCIVKA
ncbi:MAG: cupin domain-containing protein, partial [Dehalococcoidia bacterium]|nr:cupin domain-containing protein [Dehalococcoidia bacterium]